MNRRRLSTSLSIAEGFGNADPNYEGIYYANHNFVYVIMRHFNVLRRLGYIGYAAIVGELASPGAAKLVLRLLERRGLK